MKQQRILGVVHKFGHVSQCTLTFSSRPPWIIEFNNPEIGHYDSTGDDLFEALLGIRIKLEQKGWFITCYGSQIDTYPSRMSRQMSGGRKLYVMKLGEPAKEESLVDIFETTSADKIGTVEEQQKYYIKWLNSLG